MVVHDIPGIPIERLIVKNQDLVTQELCAVWFGKHIQIEVVVLCKTGQLTGGGDYCSDEAIGEREATFRRLCNCNGKKSVFSWKLQNSILYKRLEGL